MNLKVMRDVDYYAGISICFLLTFICKISKILNLKKKERNVKNILFIELSEMGSSILAYPSIKKIKEVYPDSTMHFLIFKKNRFSVEILNIIKKENILTIRDDSFFLLVLDTLKVLFQIRRQKIDISFDLELFSRFSAILNYLSKATIRVGFNNFYQEGLYRGDLQTHKVYYNPHKHISINFLSLVYSTISEKETPMLKKMIPEKELVLPKIKINNQAKKDIWSKLKKINPEINSSNELVLINPHAGNLLPIREWPLNNYIKLIKKLINHKNIFIIITGNKDAEDYQNKIMKEIDNKRVINLAGKTKFSELIDLYNISDILITNDSGPAHFSSLTSIKTFVFFGPGAPNDYKPLGKNVNIFYTNFSCSPCLTAFNHRNTPCKNNKCLKIIKVEEVYNKLLKHLK